jgi:glycosyltransferase involved in cell wall biosynthesis
MFRWSAEGAIVQLMKKLGPDVVLERYYNFGGEGVRAAARLGIPAVLEVNSPVMDHPGSLKAAIDRALLFRPLRRLREGQCRRAAALVTPLPSILPPSVPREKVFPIHWGANVDAFRPGLEPRGAAAALPFPPDSRVAVFAGSFRRWHGAQGLVRAAARVVGGPNGSLARFLFLGDGPEMSRVRRLIQRHGLGEHVHLAGAVPYREMPYHLARGHVGVAPFEPSRHGQLRLGFYWSPLKIFEYMASGLPVVTLDVKPLSEVVRADSEGILVREGDDHGLAEAIRSLLASPERAAAMGRAGRERVVEHYSWERHCEKLERVLDRVSRP